MEQLQQIIDFIKGLEIAETNLILLVTIAVLIFLIALKLGKIVKAQNVLQTRYTDLTNALNTAYYEDAEKAVKMEEVKPNNHAHQIFIKKENADSL